jgi:hypothetical protein
MLLLGGLHLDGMETLGQMGHMRPQGVLDEPDIGRFARGVPDLDTPA